jgi:hypothetical protein
MLCQGNSKSTTRRPGRGEIPRREPAVIFVAFRVLGDFNRDAQAAPR